MEDADFLKPALLCYFSLVVYIKIGITACQNPFLGTLVGLLEGINTQRAIVSIWPTC